MAPAWALVPSLELVATRELGPDLGEQVLQPVVPSSLELGEKPPKLVARVLGEALDRLLAHTDLSAAASRSHGGDDVPGARGSTSRLGARGSGAPVSAYGECAGGVAACIRRALDIRHWCLLY
jgi:hypothetical protein